MDSSKDFFELYFDYVWDNTESPRQFHRWCAVLGIAALLGRQAYIKHGHRTVYPNMLAMMIGNPGTRKSSAIDIIKHLLKDAGYKTFAGSRTSKEKFLQDMADYAFDPDKSSAVTWGNDDLVLEEFKDPSEVFICSGEFNSFTGSGNIEFLSILGDLYDNPTDWDVRNKISQSSNIHQPTINILGGNTQQGFALCVPPEAMGQGFMSRLLLIFAEDKYQDIAFPEPPEVSIHNKLVEWLVNIRMNVRGEIQLTPEAKQLLTILYSEGSGIEDGRFSYYENRRFAHLLKLCIVVAAAKMRKIIDVEEVVYANTMLSAIELDMPKALGEYGKAKLATLNNLIMQSLHESNGRGYNAQELFKRHSNDANGLKEVVECLTNLKIAGKITTLPNSLGKFIPVAKKVQKDKILNFDLLREFRKNETSKATGNVVQLARPAS